MSRIAVIAAVAAAGLVASAVPASTEARVAAPTSSGPVPVVVSPPPGTSTTPAPPVISSPVVQVTATAAARRSLPTGYYGINFDYDSLASFPGFGGFDSDLAALQPGTLRYPGGTGANWFRWRLGYPENAPGPSCSPQQPSCVKFTLADLLAAYRATGATPIFDLNVMTSTLDNQIAMLQDARSLGLPVVDVELGNELYLGNPSYVSHFPNPRSYGLRVAAYVKALHADFPGVTVAAVGALRTNTEREKNWNRVVLNVAQRHHGLPDAITLHEYEPAKTALTRAGLPALFDEPYTGVREIDTALSQLPVARPAWITEYNLSPAHPANSNPAERTFAQALFAAEMDLLAPTAGGAQLIDYWTSFGTGADNAYGGSGPALTPSGLALEWVDQAAACATASSQITFAGGPALPGGAEPALIGRVYSNGTPAQHEVLLNLSAQGAVVHSGSAVPAGQPYRQGAGAPIAPMSTAGQMSVTTGTTGRTVTLPPYSITQLGLGPAFLCPGTPIMRPIPHG